MDKIFVNQLRKNLEVYVDDMVVKIPNTTSHVEDLVEIFAEIRKYNMRLNLEKFIFGVQEVCDHYWNEKIEQFERSAKT